MGCEKKGTITGEIDLKYNGTNSKIPEIFGQDVLLLKYSANLLQKHETLSAECRKEYKRRQDKGLETLIKLGQSGIIQSADEGIYYIGAIRNDLQEYATDCINKRNNLMFAEIVAQKKTGANGQVEFLEIPYGKYILASSITKFPRLEDAKFNPLPPQPIFFAHPRRSKSGKKGNDSEP